MWVLRVAKLQSLIAAETVFDFQIIKEVAFKKTSDLTQALTSKIFRNY